MQNAPASRLHVCAVLILIVLGLLLFTPGQTKLPPFDRDEARFAQASKQMVETGDYVDIHFQGQTRYKKPIGIYWLQSISVQLTSAVDQIWAYRVPSLLGAIVAVIGTYALGAMLFGTLTGLVAGLLLATTLLLGVEARMAKTDAVQLAILVYAQFFVAVFWLRDALSRGQKMLFWAALGIAVLIKGPIVPMVVGLTLLMLSFLKRSTTWLKGLCSVEAIVLFFAIILPWVTVITIKSHGQFWFDSVGQDLLAKVASGQEGHGALPGYYLVTFFISFWPWGLLALPSALAAWHERQNRAVQFLLCWIVPSWFVFELMPTKLLHYTLPVFPAIALLVAFMLTRRFYRLEDFNITDPSIRFRLWISGALVLLIFVALGVPFMPLFISNDAVSISGVFSGLILVMGAVVLWVLRAVRPFFGLSVFLATLFNFYAVSFGQTLVNFNSFWVSRSMAELVKPFQATCPGPITAIGYSEPSLVFLLGTQTRLADTLPTEKGCHLVFLEQRVATTLPPSAESLGSVAGLNYSKGDEVQLILYRITL